MSRILCVEPFHPRSEPPMGLMKLATWHKQHGNEVQYIRGIDPYGSILGDYEPEQIDIATPPFSWETDAGLQTIRFYLERFPDAHVRVGGVKAFDLPEVYGIDRVELVRGIMPEIDECAPDYSLMPDLGRSVVRTMRGCPVGCGFCRVWKESGKIPGVIQNWKSHVNLKWKRVIYEDDNIMVAPWQHFIEVCNFTHDNELSVDFNSGFEVDPNHGLTREHAQALSYLKINPVRTAFDELKEEEGFLNAMSLIRQYITDDWRKITAYVLFNYLETPEECLYRANKVVEAGGSPYVMAFVPNTYTGGDLRRGTAWISEKYGWNLELAKRFKRFWDRRWIWISIINKNGKVTADDVWKYGRSGANGQMELAT